MATKLLIDLCKGFVERSKAQHLTGKRRDDALMDYFAGAYYALHVSGQEKEANHTGTVAAMILSTRGYAEVEAIIKDEVMRDASLAALAVEAKEMAKPESGLNIAVYDVIARKVLCRCTLSAYLAANTLDPEEVAEMTEALTLGKTYRTGGGAAPLLDISRS